MAQMCSKLQTLIKTRYFVVYLKRTRIICEGERERDKNKKIKPLPVQLVSFILSYADDY